MTELATSWASRPDSRLAKASANSEPSQLNQQPKQPKLEIPILTMVDGSLIYWFLEPLPTEARDRILPPILAAWNQLRNAGFPLLWAILAPLAVLKRWAFCAYK